MELIGYLNKTNKGKNVVRYAIITIALGKEDLPKMLNNILG